MMSEKSTVPLWPSKICKHLTMALHFFLETFQIDKKLSRVSYTECLEAESTKTLHKLCSVSEKRQSFQKIIQNIWKTSIVSKHFSEYLETLLSIHKLFQSIKKNSASFTFRLKNFLDHKNFPDSNALVLLMF